MSSSIVGPAKHARHRKKRSGLTGLVRGTEQDRTTEELILVNAGDQEGSPGDSSRPSWVMYARLGSRLYNAAWGILSERPMPEAHPLAEAVQLALASSESLHWRGVDHVLLNVSHALSTNKATDTSFDEHWAALADRFTDLKFTVHPQVHKRPTVALSTGNWGAADQALALAVELFRENYPAATAAAGTHQPTARLTATAATAHAAAAPETPPGAQDDSSGQLALAKQVIRLRERAIELLGDGDDADSWLTNHIPALGGRTPLELLNSPDGYERAERVLLRAVAGVFA